MRSGDTAASGAAPSWQSSAAIGVWTLEAHQRDVAAGKDSLLISDTVETCDALNRRIRDDTTDTRWGRGRDITTVTAARGHQVGVGDVILSRRSDPF